MRRINSTHGNNRDQEKLNNLKVSAKSHVDTRREVRKTGGGQDTVGEIEDDLLIITTDKEL